jgi:hypothetical protein
VLSAKLVSSLEVFLSVVNNNRLNKYYTCYLGGIIVSINNKLIINRDISSSEIKVLFIAKFFLSLNIKKTNRKFFLLGK